jgi:uncharacterized protein (DUF983 family)
MPLARFRFLGLNVKGRNMAISFWKAGLLSLCPACGTAPLFDSLLTIKSVCPSCGADFRKEETGDGPAVFVILVAGVICVPFILIVERVFKPPVWLLGLIALPLTAAVCVGLLRPFKSMLFATQWHFRAGEGVSANTLREEVGTKNGQEPDGQ